VRKFYLYNKSFDHNYDTHNQFIALMSIKERCFYLHLIGSSQITKSLLNLLVLNSAMTK